MELIARQGVFSYFTMLFGLQLRCIQRLSRAIYEDLESVLRFTGKHGNYSATA